MNHSPELRNRLETIRALIEHCELKELAWEETRAARVALTELELNDWPTTDQDFDDLMTESPSVEVSAEEREAIVTSVIARIRAEPARRLQNIIEKCHQYWNEHNIGNSEIHAALESIVREAQECAQALSRQPDDTLPFRKACEDADAFLVRCCIDPDDETRGGQVLKVIRQALGTYIPEERTKDQ